MTRPDVERRSAIRRSRDAAPPRFALGLDLGQVRDYTAIVVVEQVREIKPIAWEPGEPCRHLQEPEYHVRYVERFGLGTLYPDIVEAVEDLLSQPPLVDRTRLVVDGTGVGAPVVDLFLRKGASLLPVSITAGDTISFNGKTIRVPKRNLVSVLQVLFQSKRLRIPPSINEAETLLKELRNFSAKITTNGHDTYEAWREGQHDDLVLALALACWSFERTLRAPRVRLNLTGLPQGSRALAGSGSVTAPGS